MSLPPEKPVTLSMSSSADPPSADAFLYSVQIGSKGGVPARTIAVRDEEAVRLATAIVRATSLLRGGTCNEDRHGRLMLDESCVVCGVFLGGAPA